MLIKINSFKGMRPKLNPQMLDDNQALLIQNCMIHSGKIEQEYPCSIAIPECSVAPSAIHGDQHQRLYFCDGKSPLSVKIGSAEPREVKFPAPPKINLVTNVSTVDTLLAGVKCLYTPGARPTNLAPENSPVRPHYLKLEETKIDENGNHVAVFKEAGGEKIPASHVSNASTYATYELQFADGSSMKTGLTTNIQRDLLDFNGIKVGYMECSSEEVSLDNAPKPEAGFVSFRGFVITFTIRKTYIKITRSHYYLARYVDDTSAEGIPGELSEMIERKPDEKLHLSIQIDSIPKHIKKIRVYRSAGTANDAGFYFLTEFDAAGNGLFEDYQDELSEKMPNYGNPPDAMNHLVLMSGGFYAAAKNRDIYFSDPYLPHQWPAKYAVSVGYNVRAMAVRQNHLYVMTDGPLFCFVGDHPEMMAPVNMAFNHPCLSAASVAKVDDKIIYAAKYGLAILGDGGPKLFSQDLFSLDQYTKLMPDTIRGAAFNGCYFATSGNAKTVAGKEYFNAVAFDFNEGNLLAFDNVALNKYPEFEQDKFLDVPYGENLITRNNTGNKLAIHWISKEFRFDRPVAPMQIKIDFDGTGLLRLYAAKPPESNNDHVSVGEQTAQSNASSSILPDWPPVNPDNPPEPEKSNPLDHMEMVYEINLEKRKSGVAWKIPFLRRERIWYIVLEGRMSVQSIAISEDVDAI